MPAVRLSAHTLTASPAPSPPRLIRALNALSWACALAGGLLLCGIALMTCASLLGRNTSGWTVLGDFELTALGTGAAIGLFLPWCQCQLGHVRVDFFTQRASAATRGGLDRAGAAALAAMTGLLAWRAALGGLDAWRSGTTSMLMALPEWWVYIALVPALALAALVGAVQALRGTDGFGQEFSDDSHPGRGDGDGLPPSAP